MLMLFIENNVGLQRTICRFQDGGKAVMVPCYRIPLLVKQFIFWFQNYYLLRCRNDIFCTKFLKHKIVWRSEWPSFGLSPLVLKSLSFSFGGIAKALVLFCKGLSKFRSPYHINNIMRGIDLQPNSHHLSITLLGCQRSNAHMQITEPTGASSPLRYNLKIRNGWYDLIRWLWELCNTNDHVKLERHTLNGIRN